MIVPATHRIGFPETEPGESYAAVGQVCPTTGSLPAAIHRTAVLSWTRARRSPTWAPPSRLALPTAVKDDVRESLKPAQSGSSVRQLGQNWDNRADRPTDRSWSDPHKLLILWCRGWESDPHEPCGSQDFKSCASASSATPAQTQNQRLTRTASPRFRPDYPSVCPKVRPRTLRAWLRHR